MPGANYMGGRRNAVKAKGRDKNARIQRDFFAKQKVHLKDPVRATSRIPDISFAHARREASNPSLEESGWIPEPFIPGTPHATRSRLVPKVKSKLLQHIDLNEPISLAAMLERIRKTHNLAGLSAAKRDRDSAPDQSQSVSKRRKLNEGQAETGRTMHESTIAPQSHHLTARTYISGSSPSPTFRTPNSRGELSFSPKQLPFHFSSMSIPESSPRTDGGKRDITDDPSASVPIGSWSTDHFRLLSGHSPTLSVAMESPQGRGRRKTDCDESAHRTSRFHPSEIYSDWTSQRRAIGNYDGFEEGCHLVNWTQEREAPNLPCSVFDRDGLPRLIRLSPSRTSDMPVYGNLFNIKDPWKVIGQILGLEAGPHGNEADGKEDTESHHGNTYPTHSALRRSMTARSSRTSIGSVEETALGPIDGSEDDEASEDDDDHQLQLHGEPPITADEFIPLEVDGPDFDELGTMITHENEDFSQITFATPVSRPSFGEVGNTTLQQREGPLYGGVKAIMSRSSPSRPWSTTDISHRSSNEPVEDRAPSLFGAPLNAGHLEPMDLVHFADLDDQRAFQEPQPELPQAVSNAKLDIHSGPHRTQEETGSRQSLELRADVRANSADPVHMGVLEIPDLENVNGRYLGPSLFDFGDDFDASDDWYDL